MGVNPAIFSAINASISHNQRVNAADDSGISSAYFHETPPVEYSLVKHSKEILEDLKTMLEQDKCKEEDCISVYDLLNLTRNKYYECLSFDRYLCYYIEDMTDKDALFLDVDVDCENNQLIISYHCDKMYFKKNDNNLVITKSGYYAAKDILGKCGDKISERYDKFIEDISFYRDHMKNIKSVNSNFVISSDEYSIGISDNYIKDFELFARIHRCEYNYNCNSNDITEICRNNEAEIFRRVFVKISDCPEWAREELYKIREAQLKEQKKLEIKELRKQKVLGLVKKINPFRKK